MVKTNYMKIQYTQKINMCDDQLIIKCERKSTVYLPSLRGECQVDEYS